MKINQSVDMTDKQNLISSGKGLVMPDAIGQKDASEGKNVPEKEDGVTVELSDELKDMFQQQLEAQKESAKAAGKSAQDLGKIMEIARRISRGDHVPTKDEKKLMEYDFKLYQMAKMSASLNQHRKHKKHKSLFEEEENKEMRDMLRALRDDDSSEVASVGETGEAVSGDAGGESVTEE